MLTRQEHLNLVITGATGMAAATARLATESGHTVFVISKGEDECQALADELDCHAYVADITNTSEVTEAMDAALEVLGRIDGLFNVVGISGRRFGDAPLHACTEEGWDTVMNVNLRSLFLMSKAALKTMLAQEPDTHGQRGSIVNMGSVLAQHPEREHFATHAYATSKGAIHALTVSAAAYYAPHQIRINAVAPGLVKTPMSQRAQSDAAILAVLKDKQPLAPEFIAPESVARAVLFLLSPASDAITGQILTVDAGWRLS